MININTSSLTIFYESRSYQTRRPIVVFAAALKMSENAENESLDSFFAKKDKVKKKSTKTRITPDDIGQLQEKKLQKAAKKAKKESQSEMADSNNHKNHQASVSGGGDGWKGGGVVVGLLGVELLVAGVVVDGFCIGCFVLVVSSSIFRIIIWNCDIFCCASLKLLRVNMAGFL